MLTLPDQFLPQVFLLEQGFRQGLSGSLRETQSQRENRRGSRIESDSLLVWLIK